MTRIKLLGGTRLLVLASVALVCGCNRAPAPQAEPKTAREVLQRMVSAYHDAKTYADSGEARIVYTADGRNYDQTFNFSVTLERPNKLRMNVYACNLVCDGKRLQAAIEELPGQVLSVPAPERLTTSDVFRNGTLYTAMAEQVAGGPIQVALLLDDEPPVPGLAGDPVPKLLEPMKHPDGPCYRVQLEGDDGKLVFWIDRNSFVLRRMELPTKALYDVLAQQAKISDLSVVADFKGARFDQSVDPVAFQFVVPEGAKLVDDFRLIQRPEPISNLLGKPIPEFTFTTLDGKPLTRDSLAGKIAVIDFWATWCGPCFQTLPYLEAVYQKFKDRDNVVFVAVSIDQPKAPGAPAQQPGESPEEQPPASNEEVAAAFKSANLNIPIARDLKQFANISFGVQQIPNLFIIGPDGKLQDHEIGYNPELVKELPERIEKLLAGKDLFEDARRRYDERLRDYEAQFQQPAPSQSAGGDMPRANLAPPSSPTHLKLTSMWRYEGLKDPGNVLVVPGRDGNARILVVDGWNRIGELSADGKLIKLHELELPKEAESGIIGYLRTTVDSDGKRFFIGTASSAQRLHVFDEHFSRLWSYPEGTSAGGIADVQPADLDGDGHPELNVSYYDVVGVQNVSLDGRRRWANRAMANVYQLAVTGPNASGHRQLLCASQRGTLTPIDAQGRDGSPLDVNHRFVRGVFSANLTSSDRTDYCAVAMSEANQQTLVGFDLSSRELWSYKLPAGLQNHAALESVTSGNVLGARSAQWLIAGPDGSIHILSADGVEVDHFTYGQAISGLAVADLGGPALIIATSKGIEAYKVAEGAAANLSRKPER
ncbi:MAG TPA: redoxin domain-containing protein [Pirellulales bacterium]|jgi:thiol-disulfide isomerase/thioredoxin|nr:redoxin domain-containing protein [Pirellulales bacterium]